MFCGLPISVNADPVFAAQAKASKYGIGFNFRFAQTSISTGATARHTMSLLNTADKPATTSIMAASKRGGETSSAPSHRVTQS
jgi:hypothetical protein